MKSIRKQKLRHKKFISRSNNYESAVNPSKSNNSKRSHKNDKVKNQVPESTLNNNRRYRNELMNPALVKMRELEEIWKRGAKNPEESRISGKSKGGGFLNVFRSPPQPIQQNNTINNNRRYRSELMEPALVKAREIEERWKRSAKNPEEHKQIKAEIKARKKELKRLRKEEEAARKAAEEKAARKAAEEKAARKAAEEKAAREAREKIYNEMYGDNYNLYLGL